MATTSSQGEPKSPSASPRLPSPPPIAEDQTAPQSPLAPSSRESDSFLNQSQSYRSDARRIRPGTKAADMNEGPPMVELTEIDSAFQLTEHLKALHYSLTHPQDSDSTKAIDRSSAKLLSSIPAGVERSLWLYELCRFLVQKLNMFLTGLFTDTPPCSAGTCPEMRASEWQYLCAVHDPPKSCCAIDYCCHTLDWAANTLASPKFFPSRLSMGGDPQSTGTSGAQKQHQERHLTNIFRRVYRIFAHAWFQHREVFWRVEGRTGLYVLFKTVCDSYQLIPEDNYTVPPEAEGLEPDEIESHKQGSQAAPSGILKRTAEGDSRAQHEGGGITARRHKHALSRGGSIVVPVIEETEEEENGASKEKEAFPEPPTTTLGARKPGDLLKALEADVDEEVNPAKAAANVAAAAAAAAGGRSGGGSGSHYNMSPVSPHAMSAADLVTGGPGPAEEEKAAAARRQEDAAKTALSNAEGQQAATTAAADAEAAAKTVQD